MNPDDLKQTWRKQKSHLAIEPELLLQELRRNEQQFAATIFCRDVREIVVALILLPVWVFMGVSLSSPWTWYLAMPGIVWVAGFLVVDRMRHKPGAPQPGEPLRECAGRSLRQVEHQIWLLRNVLWWYLLPLMVPVFVFIGHLAWLDRDDGWNNVFDTIPPLVVVALVTGVIYWLNQLAVRKELEPRRDELRTLLSSLDDEPANQAATGG
jgi:hypothetical protein